MLRVVSSLRQPSKRVVQTATKSYAVTSMHVNGCRCGSCGHPPAC
ncbi:Zinc-dependent alcohol dehydrogenase, partial [Globisporangium polare]